MRSWGLTYFLLFLSFSVTNRRRAFLTLPSLQDGSGSALAGSARGGGAGLGPRHAARAPSAPSSAAGYVRDLMRDLRGRGRGGASGRGAPPGRVGWGRLPAQALLQLLHRLV